MKCEWCEATFNESAHMVELIQACIDMSVCVCYECALEWNSQPWLTLDLERDEEYE